MNPFGKVKVSVLGGTRPQVLKQKLSQGAHVDQLNTFNAQKDAANAQLLSTHINK